MRSIILAMAVTCFSFPALSQQCDVEFNGQLQFENHELQVQIDPRNELTITKDKTLYVNDREVFLTKEQRQWVHQYYNGIHNAIPQTATIASDAIILANEAITEVLGELLGANSHTIQELSDKLDQLKDQVYYRFYADNGNVRIHSTGFKDGTLISNQWEQEFEDTIEQVVAESLGNIMVSLGTQIIFGGGNIQELEQKMERFSEHVETKLDHQAAALEKHVNALCDTLYDIDDAERLLQNNIQELSNLDAIQINKGASLM